MTHATGTAKREAALAMLDRCRRRKRRRGVTLGADKGYDVTAFVDALRQRGVIPHVAVHGAISKFGKVRKSGVDGRTMRHPGYATSQRVRKRIEEHFGWIKAAAGLGKVKVERPRQSGRRLHLRRHRLQSRPNTQAAGAAHMTAPMNCELIGKWRIVEADLWDRDYLDLEYGRSTIFFTWEGFDEMDEV